MGKVSLFPFFFVLFTFNQKLSANRLPDQKGANKTPTGRPGQTSLVVFSFTHSTIRTCQSNRKQTFPA